MQSSAEHTEKIANASRERNLDCKQGPAALSPRSSRVLCDFCRSMSCFALPISRLSRYISGIFPPTDMPTFYDSFLECVERWPQNVALEIQRGDAVESYTYAELRQMSESIARWVTEIGLGPGSRLASLADNHPRWVAAYLGVIAAGCTAVPLDTAFHADQVTKLLKDSGTSVLFADAKHLPIAQRAVAGLRVGLVLTNSPSRDGGATELRSSLAGAASVSTGPSADLDGIFAAGAGNFRPRASSDSIAALLYTSGTTADPKGVMLSHANLLGEVEAVFGCVHLGPDDAVLGVLPLFHVLSQMANVLLPLVKGSRVDPRIARDVYALGIDILQAYGLTETTGGAFVTPPNDNVIGSVGKPLPGMEAKIADPQPQEDGASVVGEIAIRGPIVMKGYWNRPDATAAVLNDGWLLTGDLGYFDLHGNLFITGRKKEVIVLSNGKNIYPEEIEAHYSKSSYIKELCVM